MEELFTRAGVNQENAQSAVSEIKSVLTNAGISEDSISGVVEKVLPVITNTYEPAIAGRIKKGVAGDYQKMVSSVLGVNPISDTEKFEDHLKRAYEVNAEGHQGKISQLENALSDAQKSPNEESQKRIDALMQENEAQKVTILKYSDSLESLKSEYKMNSLIKDVSSSLPALKENIDFDMIEGDLKSIVSELGDRIVKKEGGFVVTGDVNSDYADKSFNDFLKDGRISRFFNFDGTQKKGNKQPTKVNANVSVEDLMKERQKALEKKTPEGVREYHRINEQIKELQNK